MRPLLTVLTAAVLMITGCGACATATKPAPPVLPTVEMPWDDGWIAPQCGGAWWDHAPIRIGLDESAEAWGPYVEEAIEWWGPQLLTLTASTTADVVIFGDPDLTRRAWTRSMVHPFSCKLSVAIVEMPVEPGSWGLRMLAHELGHVLGLAHDRDPGSVMHPITVAGVFYATLADRDRLRIRYRAKVGTCTSKESPSPSP